MIKRTVIPIHFTHFTHSCIGMHVCKISNYFIILEIIIVNDKHILAFLLYPYYLRSEKGGGEGEGELIQ